MWYVCRYCRHAIEPMAEGMGEGMIDGVDLIGLEEYVWWSGQSGGIGRECPGNGNEGHEPGDEDLPKATYALAMTALRAALRALHEVRENA